ncbi:hypothetical protein [Lysinibacillus sp. G4S2]|uniref:hypothetical protein n=1 Tax=Lysinibacillus sp. G4S2 TaxID=3055859 RepID=UPI0025A068F3|nr:hypothetical protein [Lysinibacillus sp. G4S2]MDM5250193.1 hypothetical protein [Lysinibacillus sp. G4S2]
MKVDVDNFQKLVDKLKKLVDKQSKVLDKSQNCSSLKIFVAAVALRSTFTCRKMRFCPSLNGRNSLYCLSYVKTKIKSPNYVKQKNPEIISGFDLHLLLFLHDTLPRFRKES